MRIRIGTRKSRLAMHQAEKVADKLRNAGISSTIIGMESSGDRSLGGDLASFLGQFTLGIDAALLSEEVDLAVHSSKDVPIEPNEGVETLAYLERAPTADILLTRDNDEDTVTLGEILNGDQSFDPLFALSKLPDNARVGSASSRRQSFAVGIRPDLIPLAVRGTVETRIKKLVLGWVDALILAEAGLSRLSQEGVFSNEILSLNAYRLDRSKWPCAPGQGSIVVHSRSSSDLQNIRDFLNHPPTELSVTSERSILRNWGGGCTHPAGIWDNDGWISSVVAEDDWRHNIANGLPVVLHRFEGDLNSIPSQPPVSKSEVKKPIKIEHPRLISTVISPRFTKGIAASGTSVLHYPVIEIASNSNSWPRDIGLDQKPRSEWPWLVLTSPSAARCAVESIQSIPYIGRIPWLALGEGTAMECFQLGMAASACPMAADGQEMVVWMEEWFPQRPNIILPRSNLGSTDLAERLSEIGFQVETFVAYDNRPRKLSTVPEMYPSDVLLLGSGSSAETWMNANLPIPDNVLCIGQRTLAVAQELGFQQLTALAVLELPTGDAMMEWWKHHIEASS